MTFKRAIAIGLLSSAGIGLLFLGIKFGSFNKDNTNTPKHRITSPVIRTDAEDVIYPVSTKWLFNYDLETTNPGTTLENFNIDQYINSRSYIYTTAKESSTRLTYEYNHNYGGWNDARGKYLSLNKTYLNPSYQIDSSYQDGSYSKRRLTHIFHYNQQRIIEFETTPTGNLYSLLNATAKPAYNNDIIIYSSNFHSNNNGYAYRDWEHSGINEIRKDNVHLQEENIENGLFINTSGTIQLYIDAGCNELYINGTNYSSNLDGGVNISNNDIVIKATGTNTGNTAHIFTINYFNTREPITPQPYPDPSDTRVEYLDITGLMLQILTMPFTFISTAFNLTIFEGTPYQFNFSNFILSLISIATLIFIIKLFTSGFSVVGNYTGKVQNERLTKARINETKSRTALNNRTNPNEKTSHVKTSKE